MKVYLRGAERFLKRTEKKETKAKSHEVCQENSPRMGTGKDGMGKSSIHFLALPLPLTSALLIGEASSVIFGIGGIVSSALLDGAFLSSFPAFGVPLASDDLLL